LTALDVSVVVATRNRRALLAQTLRSVLWQRDVAFEVIVVDDGSTDDTADAVRAFADPRIRVLRNETSVGVAAARNRGADDARGTWLAFTDDDDLWAPHKLARQLQAARALEREWVYGGAVVIDADAHIRRVQVPLAPEAIVTELLRSAVIPGGASNVAVHRSAWDHAGGFDARFVVMADWDLYIRLAKRGLPACVDHPLVARRLHGTSLSFDIAGIEREIRLIETEHRTSADWARMRRWMAHSCLRAGSRGAALDQFVKAAASGLMWEVAGDIWVMGGRAVASRVLGPRPPRKVASDPWVTDAEAWLQPLRQHSSTFAS
jgi:glycosyltransferase involved in cell wall biosynthesis